MIRIIETTPRVVRSNVESIEPNAPKRSARIPPKPVTCVSKFSAERFLAISSRTNLITCGNAGLSSIVDVATLSIKDIFPKIALPS